MRTYRIINTELIEKSRQFLNEIEEKKKEVISEAEKITPFKWKEYYQWQYSWNLLPNFCAFVPEPKLDKAPDGWSFDKEGHLKPNKRTKIGKLANQNLNNLPFISFDYPDKILGLNNDYNGKFVTPMIYKSYDDSEFFYKCDKRINLDPEKFEEVLISYVNSRINPRKNEKKRINDDSNS